MHAEAVDVVDGAGADGGGERDLGEGGHCLRLSSPLPLWERVDRMSVSSFETGEGLSPRIETPHPPSLREGTFSHKGRRERPHRPLKFATRRSAVALTPSLKSSVTRSLFCSTSSWLVADSTRSARSPRMVA